MPSFEESKRIQAFRRDLIKQIPRFPNDRASLRAMEAKRLTDLLITYIGWRVRYVGMRPRTVSGQAVLTGDPRAAALAPNLAAFFQAVEGGQDLTPYLSLLPHGHGYTPAADPKVVTRPDSWADKDFLLNVMGLHHFHLGLTPEAAGHMKRTNEVLFAAVGRDTFEVLGLFDHAAFEYEPDGTMTPERQKLWAAYSARADASALPGEAWLGGLGGLGITTSSQPLSVVLTAQRHVRLIRDIDSKLDDPAFVKTLYPNGPVPRRPKTQWHYRYLDLGVLDEPASHFAIFERGPS
jgi:hypothetical protein